VKPFADLLDRLSFQPQRNAKVRLIRDYLGTTPDPDRGWALAALTGDLSFAAAKPAMIRALVEERVDPVLFALSYDYIGDLAETVALIWPSAEARAEPPSLGEIVSTLHALPRGGLAKVMVPWLDSLDATGRWALLKLVTGALRVGVSARLARVALAEFGGVEPAEVEEVWHTITPPYGDLFAWLAGKGAKPSGEGRARFRPVMLAHAIEEAELAALDPAEFVAEWKWDGIRVQVVGEGGELKLFSRTGDEITGTFPDVADHLRSLNAVLDGELLVRAAGGVGLFADLQKRLNRKTVSAAQLREAPAFVRLYDILVEAGEDLRGLPFDERRRRLESFAAAQASPVFDLSPLVPIASWADLATQRLAMRDNGIEGLMLKRRASPYLAGRPKGHWYKWKRDPMLVDAVLMYAQRGHGKRSSFYSDYTFGVWKEGALVPVGKAYFGFTDAELDQIDKWVRNHTINRFGPVREVEKALVFEVAFEGLQKSPRHRAGIAMRFPRISRVRWDKPATEADGLEALEKLLPTA
jgi:DNA ligase-1